EPPLRRRRVGGARLREARRAKGGDAPGRPRQAAPPERPGEGEDPRRRGVQAAARVPRGGDGGGPREGQGPRPLQGRYQAVLRGATALKQYSKALIALLFALALPAYAQSDDRAGQVEELLETWQLEEAVDLAEEYLADAPDDPFAEFALGRARFYQGKYQ